jgi:hypothetical protein
VSVSYESRAEYTLCTYTGPFSGRELEALTSRLIEFTRATGVRCLAVDFTRSFGEFTIFERYEHAVRFAAILPQGTRVAVIARSDQILHDRFWETVCLNRAALAGVFTEFDAAIDWLLAGEEVRTLSG